MPKIKFKKIGSFPRLTKYELIGICFDKDNLKIAQLRARGDKREVVALLGREIDGLSADDVAKTIRTSLGNLKVKNLALIIPPQLTITKNIEIPSKDAKEIREMINLRAGKYTPHSREEIIIDYIDIGAYRPDHSEILLIIVERSVIKEQLEVLGKAGLKAGRVLLSSEGIARAYSALKPEIKDSPFGIIHIDSTFTDFNVILQGKPLFIRNIPLGAQHLLSEGESSRMRFGEEVKKSLETYQSENIEKMPGELRLTGAVEKLGGLEAVLNDKFRIPVKAFSYLTSFPLAEKARKEVNANKQRSFLNLIAPLLMFDELKVDLTPEEVKLSKSLEEKGREIIKTGIFGMAILILICSIFLTKLYFKTNYLENLNARYQPVNQDVQGLEKILIKVRLIKNYLAGRGYSLEVLRELHSIVPAQIYLNNIVLDEKGNFSIKGSSSSVSEVFSFTAELEKSKYFRDVKTRHTTQTKRENKDLADFEITALVEQ